MHYGETCDTRKTNGEPGVKPHLSPYLPVFQPKKEKGESVKAKRGNTSQTVDFYPVNGGFSVYKVALYVRQVTLYARKHPL